jgi:hypothetical protein
VAGGAVIALPVGLLGSFMGWLRPAARLRRRNRLRIGHRAR